MTKEDVQKRLHNLIHTINPGHFVYTYPPHKIYPRIPEGFQILSVWDANNDEDLNIYIHIPFCPQKCGYCNLESVAVNKDDNLIDRYIDCLGKEMDLYKEVMSKFKITTVYVGGGSPSYLSEERLERLFKLINNKVVDTHTLKEFCIEISPSNTSEMKVKLMKQYCITRVSLAIQSFDDKHVRYMGRNYTKEDSETIFKLLKRYDFDNINIDIMYGYPSQSMKMWLDSVKKALVLKPGTLSIYPLNIKPLTPFWKLMGGEKGIDRAKVYDMYSKARLLILAEGYEQDTRLRFVLPKVGRYAHKDETIKGKPVKGFGVAAQSYSGTVHYRGPYSVSHCKEDIMEYIKDIEAGKHPAKYAFFMDKDEMMRRTIVMNVRHQAFNRESFKQKYRQYPEEAFPDEYAVLLENRYIEIKGDYIRLTEEGFRYSDSIAKLFFSPIILKMQEEYVYV